MSKVTSVGCGIMGSALIREFMRAGHDVTIVDVNKENANPFIEKGAEFEYELSNALDADVIVLNVPDHIIAEKVLSSCPENAFEDRIVVNATGNSPQDVYASEKIVVDNGGKYLDAAIECYPNEVGPEHGYVVYSGSKEAYQKVEHILSALSAPQYLGEEVASASVTDMAVIGIHYGTMMSMLEGAALCMEYNYSLEEYARQIDAILPLTNQASLRQIVDELTDFKGEFKDAQEATLNIETNGLRMIVESMKHKNINTDFSDHIVKIMERAIDNGYGKKNFVSVISEMKK